MIGLVGKTLKMDIYREEREGRYFIDAKGLSSRGAEQRRAAQFPCWATHQPSLARLHVRGDKTYPVDEKINRGIYRL